MPIKLNSTHNSQLRSLFPKTFLSSNVLDDERVLQIPKNFNFALKFSESARKRIFSNGGKCITFINFSHV